MAMLLGAAASRADLALRRIPIVNLLAPKRIYIAPDDHTDYIWTAGESDYQQAFLETLDYYLDRADSTAGLPSEYQSRWNCDGNFWIWTYEKNRTPAQFQRLIGRIRDGHIGVPLNPLVVLLGGAPAEAVVRGMYYPGKLARRYNLQFTLAYSMENQTLPYGVGALWAGAGAKYSWKGICGCGSQVPDAWDRPHDIYWWVGPDGSKILMKWNSMLTDGASIGGYGEARDPNGIVDLVDGNASFLARYAYRVIGAFGQGLDDFKTLTQAFVAAAQAKTNASRQVIVSNELDFFQDFEATYGATLPSQACTFGNEWELDGASLAEVFARVKRALEKLRAAEALATLVCLKDITFMNAREAARDLAWMNFGLEFEHCMGGGGPQGLSNDRALWQHRITQEIETYVDALHDDAVSALGAMIVKTGTALRFFIFNSLSWPRTDIADLAYDGTANIHVVDLATDQDVPSQVVTVDGVQYLRILASNVPPVGYKVFEIRSGAGQDFSSGAPTTSSSNTVENEFYRVTVATNGAISSLQDKTRSNQEFALSIGGRTINDLGFAAGTLAVESSGPVSTTLLATINSSSPLKHTSRITLFRNSTRLDIRNDINQNFDATFVWNFGFNLNTPALRHEEVGAVILAKLLADGGHYSPTNARYDWLTLNHFADMTDANGSVGVTLSNTDCYYMQRGNSSASTLDVSTPQIKVLAGGRAPNNNQSQILNQGGDGHFLQRFALQTHGAYDQVDAMKFALEHQNPLVTGAVTGGSEYPEASFSLLAISNPNVLLWALKPAEDAIYDGVVARVWNLSNAPASFTITLRDDSMSSVRQVTHIETYVATRPVSNGALTDSLSAQQLKTYAMLPASLFAKLDQQVHLPAIPENAADTGQFVKQQMPWWKTWWRRMFEP